VTCTVTIAGIGSHSGSGEEWADDQNAMTSAEAQAFKRACSCFGLGRYFYSFAEMWVELDEHKQPRKFPTLPAWALPKEQAEKKSTAARSDAANATLSVRKGPLDASAAGRIESLRREVGTELYQSILEAAGNVRSARDIPNQQVQQNVLKWMESGARGIARMREIAAELSEPAFYAILDEQGVESLTKIPSFGVVKKLVDAMTLALSEQAQRRGLPESTPAA
jgi:hypothetical protein